MRETGLQRLTLNDIKPLNQHYINAYFIRRDILRFSEEYARGRLLDIGCGNKPYQSFFSNITSAYVGCDIVQSSDNSVDIICPADDLNFPDDSFDTVFSTQVMEHVANHTGMIRESRRVLKKGGYGIFTMPFAWELHEEPYDFFRFTKYALEELFSANGFEVVTVQSNGGKWAAIFQLWVNVLYSTRRYKTIRSRLIKLLFVRLRFIVLYNRFAIWLDKKFFDDILTLNYLVVVRKT